MSRTFCKIADGTVIDRAVFDDAGLPEGWPDASSWIEGDAAQIGWTYDGTSFTAPPSPPPPPPVTPQLEPWRFKTVVALAFPPPDGGAQLDSLKALINSAVTDPMTRNIILSQLESPPGGMYAIDDPLFSNAELMAATGKTEADIQAMWTQGLGLAA